MEIKIEQDALVVFIGAMATGKSTFASTHFPKHNVIESDFIREQLTGDFQNQDYNSATFAIFFATIEARAKAGILTVVDSTGNQNVLDQTKMIAAKYDRPLVAIVFPELLESEFTEERLQHRWRYKSIYKRQVNRISQQTIPAEYHTYHLTDINDALVTYEKYSDAHTLESHYSYIIIPDLHGEYRVLEEYANMYKYDENVKFISLGDIVDRGESSYLTFNLVFDLIAEGKMDNVISNHDNKLMRYFKKWLADDDDDKYHQFNGYKKYGMSIAHGLDITLNEFYDLSALLMDDYVDRFINYYDTSHPYLMVEKPNGLHYFVHAGVTSGVATGQKMNKRDLSGVIYESMDSPDQLTDIFKHVQEDVHVHVGHEYNSDDITFHPNKDGTRWIVEHDIGLGKRSTDVHPVFMKID